MFRLLILTCFLSSAFGVVLAEEADSKLKMCAEKSAAFTSQTLRDASCKGD